VRFCSNSLDEVRAITEKIEGEHSRVAHGTGPLRFERAGLKGNSVLLGWASAGLAQTARGSVPEPTLHISMGSHGRYLFGRQEIAVGSGAALLIPATWEHTRRTSPGALFGILMSGTALDAELGARRARAGEERTLNACAFGTDGPDWRVIESALADLVEALGSDGSPRRRALCEARTIAAIASVILSQSTVTRSTIPSAWRLGNLESWIDAHLAEPITLGRLCAVARTGQRSLQLAFQSRRGLSPMRFVTQRRLAASHRELLRAGSSGDVANIAVGAGFSHLGRFSIAYRHAYGESPSQTLRRPRKFS
jgi:AraC-like DNA-binding protein